MPRPLPCKSASTICSLLCPTSPILRKRRSITPPLMKSCYRPVPLSGAGISAHIYSGSLLNLAFGFGPDSWENVFTQYAHNTFVSSLYEIGAVGLASIIVLFVSNFTFAFGSVPEHRLPVVSAHLGFLILNMATMPLWLIEGNILLALTLAYTLHDQMPRRVRVRLCARIWSFAIRNKARYRSIALTSRAIKTALRASDPKVDPLLGPSRCPSLAGASPARTSGSAGCARSSPLKDLPRSHGEKAEGDRRFP